MFYEINLDFESIGIVEKDLEITQLKRIFHILHLLKRQEEVSMVTLGTIDPA